MLILLGLLFALLMYWRPGVTWLACGARFESYIVQSPKSQKGLLPMCQSSNILLLFNFFGGVKQLAIDGLLQWD